MIVLVAPVSVGCILKPSSFFLVGFPRKGNLLVKDNREKNRWIDRKMDIEKREKREKDREREREREKERKRREGGREREKKGERDGGRERKKEREIWRDKEEKNNQGFSHLRIHQVALPSMRPSNQILL